MRKWRTTLSVAMAIRPSANSERMMQRMRRITCTLRTRWTGSTVRKRPRSVRNSRWRLSSSNCVSPDSMSTPMMTITQEAIPVEGSNVTWSVSKRRCDRSRREAGKWHGILRVMMQVLALMGITQTSHTQMLAVR